mmetsp:Transcript_21738/g.41471  ORF Transcript_21738/g.41471 Transcript_21738/m.41471 type:complete len:86 (+) Transcript_21738:238-495(+)|eukprot:CAMPEP_0114247822 /NCGR_PEP_ID=MMETSP0058-20121206/13231_1 /TAXON_ID=36894 /ORGANISM="Pyramimonas parkeae, CCMP726" /LENGTH=85 /DNA_ID=CAMNT_0001361161 /DNA_START=209 /DNA_END=466 /DNA_ORIENTATION=-
MNEVKVDDLESATLLTPESPIRTCADQNTTAVVCNVCKRQVDRGLAPGTPKEHAQQMFMPVYYECYAFAICMLLLLPAVVGMLHL